jgi:hypothetical protein
MFLPPPSALCLRANFERVDIQNKQHVNIPLATLLLLLLLAAHKQMSLRMHGKSTVNCSASEIVCRTKSFVWLSAHSERILCSLLARSVHVLAEESAEEASERGTRKKTQLELLHFSIYGST